MNARQDEDEERRRIQRLKNAKCTMRRRNVEYCARNPPLHGNLNDTFMTPEDLEYRTPIGTITEVALLA